MTLISVELCIPVTHCAAYTVDFSDGSTGSSSLEDGQLLGGQDRVSFRFVALALTSVTGTSWFFQEKAVE